MVFGHSLLRRLGSDARATGDPNGVRRVGPMMNRAPAPGT